MFEVIRRIWKAGTATESGAQLSAAPPARVRGRIFFAEKECAECEICLRACPAGAITFGGSGDRRRPEVSYDRCVFCGFCAEVCPQQSIRFTTDYHLATKNSAENELGLELEQRIKSVLGRSLHIRHVDAGSCNGCDFEMSTLNNPVYDIQRFGIDFVASPRHADLLMVTGGVTRHLEEALRKTCSAAADPKMVVAVGACACGGGIVGQNYANHGGVDKIVPVLVRIPGCPPRPQALIEGILLALDRCGELKRA